jgi:hypothetical protein
MEQPAPKNVCSAKASDTCRPSSSDSGTCNQIEPIEHRPVRANGPGGVNDPVSSRPESVEKSGKTRLLLLPDNAESVKQWHAHVRL